MDSDAVTGLMTDMLGVAPDPGLAALAAGAGGNPLLLGELIAGLRDEGKIRSERDSARLACAELPQRFRAVVQRWTEALGTRTRQLLAVGAVLGQSFKVGDVAALLGEPPARLLPEVETALSAGVLEVTSQALSFGSELVWRAVADSVPPSARQALHRQIGEYLLGQGSSAIEAAEHLAEAGRPCAPAALARLGRAGQTLLATAPQTAAEVALRALDLTDPGDPVRYPRIVTAVEALTAASRLTEAEQLIGSTLAAPRLVPPAATIWLRSLLSSVLLYSGRPAAAVAEAENLLADTRLPGPARAEAEVSVLLGCCLVPGDLEQARHRAEHLLADQHSVGAPGVPAALLVSAVLAWRAGRLAAALDLARQANRPGLTAVPRHSWIAPLLLGSMLISLGERAEAGAVVRVLTADARALGTADRDACTEILNAALALADGHAADAAARAERGLRQAAVHGAQLLSPYGHAILATVQLRGGDLASAVRTVQKAQALQSEHGPGYGYGKCLLAAAQLAAARQDADGAAGLAAGLCARLADQPAVLLEDLSGPGWLVRFALGRQQKERAETVAAAIGGLAAANPGFPGVCAAAAHARGLFDRDADLLARAAADSPDGWAAASAAEDLGVLLVDRQDFGPAGRHLEEALAGYERAAALRDGRRVRRRLRGIGIRRRHFSRANRPSSGWASLTDTERTVSDLVAQGLTNQRIADELFLSTHTVAFHLRQVFRKLDISSRVDLARVLTERSQARDQERAG